MTGKQYYKDMFLADEYPCNAGIRWANKQPGATKLNLAKEAIQVWREWLAVHSAESEVLSLLSTDSIWSVRQYVAENPATTIEILQVLVVDESGWVRFSARHSLFPRLNLTK